MHIFFSHFYINTLKHDMLTQVINKTMFKKNRFVAPEIFVRVASFKAEGLRDSIKYFDVNSEVLRWKKS